LFCRVIRRIFWLGLWIFGLALLIWYPLRWWPGDRFVAVRLVNYFMPWLLVVLIPGLVLAGLARRVWLGVTLAIPTLLISLTFAPLFLPRPTLAQAGSTPLKVMSYNKLWRNGNINAMQDLIRQEDPDIILLQEIYPKTARKLKERLADDYPDSELHLAYDPYLYQAIISRYPLTPAASAPKHGRVQKVTVHTPDGPIAVWNVHPHPPLPWSRQYREIARLVDDIAAVEGPLIVGGDFNTTDQAETYRMINQHLANAHWEAGWGFGFSFPSTHRRFKGVVPLPSLIRIDHIFYSDHFYALTAGTVARSGGSDHLPVVAELIWQNHR
ncbi:MAG: endonuclease/exonuclease/phosphatase family protein, partial [Anaerolineae bacterium]|nr:endonuclease/exonuclease/phosphatase family protein [Anaerolineae bacterium]